MTLLYHEKQVAALCGVHCINTLLQGPYFNEIDLAQIAHQLDELERAVMAEGGGAEYQQFLNEASGNVAMDGMFSIQVGDREVVCVCVSSCMCTCTGHGLARWRVGDCWRSYALRPGKLLVLVGEATGGHL